MTTAEQILRKHVKVDWIISGESGKSILAAMEEYKKTREEPKEIQKVKQQIVDALFELQAALNKYEGLIIENRPLEVFNISEQIKEIWK